MNTDMNPYRIFHRWYDEAQESGIKEPGIMTLVTVDPGYQVRMEGRLQVDTLSF